MAREEDWWTVPTSGHSAYPYWHMPLSQVHFYGNSKMEEVLQSCPEDWRDHYAANNKGNLNLDDFGDMLTDDDEKKGTSLLESLGLLKKPTPITRRV